MTASKERTSKQDRLDKRTQLSLLFYAGLQGDAHAYECFLRDLTPIIKAAVRKKLRPEEVDDVVQETLISIHKARHTYDHQRPLMPWIRAIIQFRVADLLRTVYRQPSEHEIDLETILDPVADVTESAFPNESYNELIKSLSEREKNILTMMHVEEFTARETGHLLDLKESAVKVAAHRAIKKLRERWSK